MPKTIVSKPKARPLVQLSTAVLVDRHSTHDAAIAKAGDYELGHSYPTEIAKRNKCAVKMELIKRARGGDTHAIAYAIRRGWPGFKQQLKAVAAE